MEQITLSITWLPFTTFSAVSFNNADNIWSFLNGGMLDESINSNKIDLVCAEYLFDSIR